MKRKLTVFISLFYFVTLAGQFLSAEACTFCPEPYFTYTNHPDLPLDNFAAGRLGVLQPRYARSYLLVAYRYLSNAPLSREEQTAMVKLWNDRMMDVSSESGCSTDTSAWLKARTIVYGAPKLDNIDTELPVDKDAPYQTYCNCQTSAFATAVNTLKALVEKFGGRSVEVTGWLHAQDQVFLNCGYPLYSDKPLSKAIPAELPATVDPLLRRNRAYQIAAANFYAQNFDVARKEFEDISNDAGSPWKQIAAYLAVRCMLRQASLAKELDTPLLAAAQERLKQLSADPANKNMFADYDELKNFIAARLSPVQHINALAKENITTQSTAELTKTIDMILKDDGNQPESKDYSKLPASLKQIDVVDWMLTFQSNDGSAAQHAIQRWKQTHSLAWLVAAAAAVNARDPEADAILAAASEVQSGPAYWTLFFHTNRINLARGKIDSVRSELDKLLDNPPSDLPAGSLNVFKMQRLPLSGNLNEFVRYGIQIPLSICSNGGVEQVPDEISRTKVMPEFTPEAGSVLQNKLPLELLKQVAGNQQIPADLRNNVAWTSWVRAVLIDDNADALELAKTARTLNKAKEKLFDAYLAASTAEQRKFAAAFLMLQFSSAEPNVTWGPLSEDNYGDASGWWWSEKPATKIPSGNDNSESVYAFDPIFLTKDQKNRAKQQLAKLDVVETAPDYFAKLVLSFAKAHPDDWRVPEALHWLVKATRYGSTSASTSAFSKQAFVLLHTRYKTSPWAKKTPYYY